jgi:hypothetical protein
MVAAEAAVTKVFFIAHLPTLGMTFRSFVFSRSDLAFFCWGRGSNASSR